MTENSLTFDQPIFDNQPTFDDDLEPEITAHDAYILKEYLSTVKLMAAALITFLVANAGENLQGQIEREMQLGHWLIHILPPEAVPLISKTYTDLLAHSNQAITEVIVGQMSDYFGPAAMALIGALVIKGVFLKPLLNETSVTKEDFALIEPLLRTGVFMIVAITYLSYLLNEVQQTPVDQQDMLAFSVPLFLALLAILSNMRTFHKEWKKGKTMTETGANNSLPGINIAE